MKDVVPRISVVVALYNEEAVLGTLLKRLESVLEPYASEMIFVSDGSTDSTVSLLSDATKKNVRIKIINLTRNFGQQIAMSAGIDHADGDVVITMDADLQDPPELIPEMLEKWREGNKVVYAVRRFRKSDGFLKQASASIFYRVFNKIATIDILAHASDFRLIDRDVVGALRTMPERTRFLRGMVPWLGFPHATLFYDRPSRPNGTTKYSFKKMVMLSLDGIISFSPNLLRTASVVGLFSMIFAFVVGLYFIFAHLVLEVTIQGWSSFMVVVFFFGGIQLLTIGILSEYLGRVFEEVKQRPLYVIKNTIWPSKLRDDT